MEEYYAQIKFLNTPHQPSEEDQIYLDRLQRHIRQFYWEIEMEETDPYWKKVRKLQTNHMIRSKMKLVGFDTTK